MPQRKQACAPLVVGTLIDASAFRTPCSHIGIAHASVDVGPHHQGQAIMWEPMVENGAGGACGEAVLAPVLTRFYISIPWTDCVASTIASIGWCLDRSVHTDRRFTALRMALRSRKGAGLVHYSARGSMRPMPILRS